MDEEISLWKGATSQWINFWNHLLGLLVIAGIVAGGLFFPPAFIALIFPVGFMLWKYLVVRAKTYELTTERIKITSGVFNQEIEEIELYRVKDSQLVKPFWMRLTGLASITLDTSDRSNPLLSIPAVAGGMELREMLRKQVELTRDKKRVRELDFDQVGADEPIPDGA